MGVKTTRTYTCDQCGKPVTELYGPLLVTVRSLTEPQCNADLVFDTFKCAADYMTSDGAPYGRAPFRT